MSAGMTLLELLMVVTVVGVLVVVALPSYRSFLEQGYQREAEDLLAAIYSGQRAYLLENNTYFDNPMTMDQWHVIHLDDPNVASSLPVTFTVSASGSGSSATFDVTAERTDGPCAGQTQTLDELRASGGTWTGCAGL